MTNGVKGIKGFPKGKSYFKNCLYCNKIFPVRGISYLDTKFCSRECLGRARSSGMVKAKPRTGKVFTCPVCRKSFYRQPAYISSSKYCSYECRNIGLRVPGSKVELNCGFCGKKYSAYRSQVKWRGSRFCSLACFKGYKKTKYYERKKKGKASGAVLKKALWGIFSQYIRLRDGGVCISCGKKSYWRKMDAGHYIPKTASLSLYFDERNVNCQCTYCNRWLHGNLSKYAIALRRKYGKDILEELDEKRREIKKISVVEYESLIEEYKGKKAEFQRLLTI